MAQDLVFPAYAGMIPTEIHVSPYPTGVPRIRGDDPSHRYAVTVICAVFPAYAGIILGG